MIIFESMEHKRSGQGSNYFLFPTIFMSIFSFVAIFVRAFFYYRNDGRKNFIIRKLFLLQYIHYILYIYYIHIIYCILYYCILYILYIVLLHIYIIYCLYIYIVYICIYLYWCLEYLIHKTNSYLYIQIYTYIYILLFPTNVLLFKSVQYLKVELYNYICQTIENSRFHVTLCLMSYWQSFRRDIYLFKQFLISTKYMNS